MELSKESMAVRFCFGSLCFGQGPDFVSRQSAALKCLLSCLYCVKDGRAVVASPAALYQCLRPDLTLPQ